MNRGEHFEVERAAAGDERFCYSRQAHQDAFSAHEMSVGDFDGVTVLLVEDDPISLEALELIFAHYGAQVLSAESVRGALQQFEDGTPSLVISDIGLPQGDGYMLLRAIRSREQRDGGGHVPAIAISGFPSRESSERARQAGFDAFLHKPVETSELLKLARAMVAPS
jgi:CheY-like chemotaxis protein